MDDKWLQRVAGKYIRFRLYTTTVLYTVLQGWVEDKPSNPRAITVQIDDPGQEHRMQPVDMQYVQCILKDKINLHRTVTLLCGGRCPVKGVEQIRWDVENQGAFSDASEYS